MYTVTVLSPDPDEVILDRTWSDPPKIPINAKRAKDPAPTNINFLLAVAGRGEYVSGTFDLGKAEYFALFQGNQDNIELEEGVEGNDEKTEMRGVLCDDIASKVPR